MKKLIALIVTLLALTGCGGRGDEPVETAVIRLFDLAPSAESKWPRDRTRELPKEIEGLRTYRQLRVRKLGRVNMFPEGGGDSRLALIAPTGTRHRFRLQLPPDAMMRIGLGYLPQPAAEGVPVRFEVRIAVAEDRPKKRALEQTITARTDGGWEDVEVDLSRWSEQEVELTLATFGAETDPQVWASWSAPEIMSRKGSEPGPDVILISLDTLRADRLGCYGYRLDTSPNLDEFAAEGIRFETAVSQAPWTLPSHKALFTGLYPTTRGIERAPVLAQKLRDAGFRTEALTGGGQMDFRMGFAKGFENYRVFDWIRNLDWLEDWLGRSSRRRRFLFLHTYEIHDPYIHTEFTEGKDGGRAHDYFDKKIWWGLRADLSEAERDYVGRLYDGGIAYTDGQLGRLFALLEKSGALDRSIVIVTSDHGEQFWEHGSWRHGMNLYDDQLLVPLIVRLPRSVEKALTGGRDLRGSVVEQQVRLVDLLPTILDLLGIPMEHRINGRSLTALLRGHDLPAEDAYAEKLNTAHRESKALRTERFKFIYSFPKAKGVKQGLEESWELYDLERDPGEHSNLADRYPDRVAELDARLRTLFELLEDPDKAEETRDLDPDLEERLRALGYLGGD